MLINSKKTAQEIKQIGYDLGFETIKISKPSLARAENLFERWLKLGNQGEMQYLQRHNLKRVNINQIFEPTVSVISVSLRYLPENIETTKKQLQNTKKPNISVYARGRDYHKLMRKMLNKFAKQIEIYLDNELKNLGMELKARPFVDSAPVLEKSYAEKAGIGWVGKHTNIVNKDKGSFFFLGELAINLKLATDDRVENHCGSCTKCIDVCPTNAIIAPYMLDAKKCISYLTIEHKGIISDKLKQQIGNRIFGCDDCQLYCPWNRFAKKVDTDSFLIRKDLDDKNFLELLSWSEEEFLQKTEGSPIRRMGFDVWQRNLVIGSGNYLKNHKDKNLLVKIKNIKTNNFATKNAINWVLEITKKSNY